MYENTQVFGFDGKSYCSYCGEVEKPNVVIEGCTVHIYHRCDCEGAKAELEIRKLEEKISSIQKVNEAKINEIKFKKELSDLKRKYKIKEED